jgi:hypothetical protein
MGVFVARLSSLKDEPRVVLGIKLASLTYKVTKMHLSHVVEAM